VFVQAPKDGRKGRVKQSVTLRDSTSRRKTAFLNDIASRFALTMATNGLSTDQLKARYGGTGHADMSKYDWMTSQHRDTYASHMGHYDQMVYLSTAQNQSIARTHFDMMQKMIEPCGPPPPTKNIDKILEQKTMGEQ